MPSFNPQSIAIIADPHFHDLAGDYGVSGIMAGGRRMTLRPFADMVRSTRIFNESGSALRHALDDIAVREIRHVVLLGDYSDDGQAATMQGLRALLDEYIAAGMRFFAVPGNHDIFGPHGRHRSKRFLNERGGRDLVTSNSDRAPDPDDDAVIVTERMHCAGYPDGLNVLSDAGFFRSPGYLYWETPFGADDDPDARRYEISSPDGMVVRSLMDASYLVEPFEGVWLLMIDANVFVPLDGAQTDDDDAFADSTDAGWNAMLVHKRFILEWIADVSRRATAGGKTLLAFSHYPALDPLDGTRGDELAVLGRTGLLRRIPEPDVGRALITAGIRVHFSGHLHVNDTARVVETDGFLVNVSVPSLVAFPGAYKIVHVSPEKLAVETVTLDGLQLDTDIMSVYRTEARAANIDTPRLLQADSYPVFLSEHIGHLVGRRHLRREWPENLAKAVRELDLLDLAILALTQQRLPIEGLAASLRPERSNGDIASRLTAMAAQHGVPPDALARIPVLAFLGDWYRARMGSDLGTSAIAPSDLAAYRLLSRLYADHANEHGTGRAAFAKILRMFERFISGLPSRNFTIDLETGDITPAVIS